MAVSPMSSTTPAVSTITLTSKSDHTGVVVGGVVVGLVLFFVLLCAISYFFPRWVHVRRIRVRQTRARQTQGPDISRWGRGHVRQPYNPGGAVKRDEKPGPQIADAYGLPPRYPPGQEAPEINIPITGPHVGDKLQQQQEHWRFGQSRAHVPTPFTGYGPVVGGPSPSTPVTGGVGTMDGRPDQVLDGRDPEEWQPPA